MCVCVCVCVCVCDKKIVSSNVISILYKSNQYIQEILTIFYL